MNIAGKILDRKWLGLAIGVVFLFLAFRNFKYDEFKNALLYFNFSYLPAIYLLLIISYIIRAIRWRYILGHVKKISLYNSFAIILIGQMGNSLLPLRLGELMRAYAIGNREKISKSLSFTSIIVERVIDGIVLAALLATIAFVFHLIFQIRFIIISSFIIFGLALLSFILFAYGIYRLPAFLRNPFLDGWIQKFTVLSPLISEFRRGLQIFKNKKQLLIILTLSLIIWSFEAFIYFLLFKALSAQLPFYASLFVLGIANLGVAVPSMPGHFGTFHYFFILALLIFGVGQSQGLAYAIIIHGIGYIFVVFSGMLFAFLFSRRLAMCDILPDIKIFQKKLPEIANPGAGENATKDREGV